MQYPNAFTVAESFEGLHIEVTVNAQDIGQYGLTGRSLENPLSAAGAAARTTVRQSLRDLANRINKNAIDAQIKQHAAELDVEREAAAQAIQAAKDETAKMLGELYDVCEQQHAKSTETRESTFAATIDRITRERDEAVAALFAKHKRSNAAKAAHMRKASKAGRK